MRTVDVIVITSPPLEVPMNPAVGKAQRTNSKVEDMTQFIF
jgi:hypothetical protein